ncbi:MAG TPA: hypothetical protein VMH06_03405 [Thermodesulfovibrionales bacterium]|nr:hypothetical protein [Thermodesulfovibrionales bacterium]
MSGRFYTPVVFAGVILAVVITLKVLNWIPSVFEEGLLQQYGSVEEAKAALHMKDVHVPSYFPPRLLWPPSRILAQTKPFDAVVMEFRDKEKGDVALVIVQSASERFRPDRKIEMVQTKERVTYLLKGREALLDIGACRNEEPCCTLSWKEGPYRMTLVMKSVPVDLIRVAESMVH